MNLVDSALRRPYTVLVLVVGLLLGAILAVRRMPQDVFPSLGIPTIYVAQPYGGMDPAQMEGYLTYYYEYHFLYITGIEHVESKSIQGASILKLQFHPGTDMSQAMAETIGYVNRSRAFMPPGTVPPFVMRFDAGSVPVGNLVFTSNTRTVGQLQDAALNLVRPLFATLPGVSAPPPFGGSARAIVVNLKPDRLRSCNLSPDDVVAAISAANTITPSGNINLGGSYPMVPLNSVVKSIKELENVPLRTGTFPAVFLRDVGEVVDGSDIITCYALANGLRTVYIPVTKRADASTVAVVDLVKKNLPRFQNVLPDDVHISYEFDQSIFAKEALHGLASEAALGALLTGVMVLLFLRDWRSAFIVIINIPVSILGAAFGLWVTGQTLNLMTLGGLALAVGVLVDEATVAVENIHARLARGESIARASYSGVVETTAPRLLAMLCILSVFLPTLFMQGAARALFVPLSLAVGFSMVCSYLLSSTFVPVLSVWFLQHHGSFKEARWMEFCQTRFARLAETLIRLRIITCLVWLGLASAIILVFGRQLGSEIFPENDTGQFQLRFRGSPGTRLDLTEALATNVLHTIEHELGPGSVKLSLGFVGVHAPSYPINLIHLWNSGSEEGVLQIQLNPSLHVHTAAFEQRLRGILARDYPNAEFSFEPSDIVSRVMSFGSPTPIEVAVMGQNLNTSFQYAEKIREKLSHIEILRDLHYGQPLKYPTVDVQVNRERAGIMGITVADVGRSLVEATSSSRFTVPNYWADPNSGIAFQVQVQVPGKNMTSMEEVKNIPVEGQNHNSALLRNVASVSAGSATGEYDRYNMQRMLTLSANVYGTDLGTAGQRVHAAVAAAGAPPPRTQVAVRGQLAPMNDIFAGLSTGLLLTVGVIFLLLTAYFQSFRLALAVVSSVPAVLAGVAGMLFVTHTTLNLESFMGSIMSIGVAVANAILLITVAERARRMGSSASEAGRESVRSRLRPVFMTTSAMIAGMIPMALGLGAGGGLSAPLGRAVIGGLLLGTPATLTLLPAIFTLLQNRASQHSASLSPEDPESVHYGKREESGPS